MKAYLRILFAAVLCAGLFSAFALVFAHFQPAFAADTATAAVVDVTADVTASTAEAAVEAVTATAVKWQESAAYLIGLVAAALGAALGWVTRKLFGSDGKIPLSDENRAAVDNAIQAGLQRAAAYLQDKVTGLPDWQVENKTVATVSSFVLASAPTALKTLGISAAALEDMIREKLADTAQATGSADA